jgi:predicted MFS family arabinose efflux permease
MTANPLPVAPRDESGAKEHKGLVVGAAGMMVAGSLTNFLSPLVAVSFADQFGFGIARTGLLVAGGQGGVALSAVAILPFLPRLDRRKVGVGGALIAAVCLALTGYVRGFGAVLVLQIVMGLAAGFAYACANSALAYARQPERAFSIVIITLMLSGAAMLTLGPTLHDVWPKAGVHVGIAGAELLCIVFIARLPDVRGLPKDGLSAVQPDGETNTPMAPPSKAWAQPSRLRGIFSPAILLIGAVWMINVGTLMIWTYAHTIGEGTGLSAQNTSTFLGLSQLIGLVGAGITLGFGGKVGKMVLIVPAVISLAVGNLLIGTATSPPVFIEGFLAVNIAFYCLEPLLLALAAELDTNSGQLVVLVGAMTLVAGGGAPALGGWIAGAGGDWSRLGVTALALGLLALPLLIPPIRTAKTRATSEAELARAR